MATYGDILRGTRRAKGLRERARGFQSMADSAGSFVTPAGQVQGMGGMTSPTPQGVDWGNVLKTGMGSYLARQSEKKADAQDDTIDRLNEQFMTETLGSDPESMKLFQMTQLGVPGAEQALAEKIAPKRQPLATFTQFLSQNPDLDDESTIAMGQQSGIGPELSIGIRNAAREGKLGREKAVMDKENREFGRTLLRDENLAALRAQGKPQQQGLTPGQRNQKTTMMKESDKQLEEFSKSAGKFPQVMSAVEKDNSFGLGSKIAEAAAGYEGLGSSIIAPLGKSQLSEGAMMLKEYVTGETLRRMAQLGGNDSNYELNVIAGSLPTVLNDKDAAIAMLKKIHEWEETTRLAIKMRRDDIQTERWFSNQPNQDDYYQMAKKMRAAGQTGYPTPPSPAANAGQLQGVPGQQMNDVESLLDELGIMQ